MSEHAPAPQVSPSPPELSDPLLLALMDGVALSVAIINQATAHRLTCPAVAPAEAAAYLEAVIQESYKRLGRFWAVLEETDLRTAGRHLIIAYCREVATTALTGVSFLKQFQPSPPDASSPPPGEA